jgi:hypothetical protein
MKDSIKIWLVILAVCVADAAVDIAQRRALSKRIEALEQFRSSAESNALVLTIDPKRGRLISVQAPGAGPVEIENFTIYNINGEWRATWQAK